MLARHIRPRAGRVRWPARLWHLATAGCWCALAALAAGSWGDAEGAAIGEAALILAGGFLWTEAFFLLGGRRSRAAAPPADTGSAEGIPREDEAEEVEAAGAEGEEPLPPEAEALLERILHLDQVAVEAIMTPRGRIAHVSGTHSIADALAMMRRLGRTRLPVVAGDSLDRILGIVHAKDLAPAAHDPATAAGTLRRHLRRWLRVPQGHTVAQLLEDFRRNRVHVGIVGDSLGRTLGLVTLSDVFVHITGTRSAEPDGAPQTPAGEARPADGRAGGNGAAGPEVAP
jgi:CBS domain-containing protein